MNPLLSATARLLVGLVLVAATTAQAQSIPGVGDKELTAAMTAFISAEQLVSGEIPSPDQLLSEVKAYIAKDPSQKIQRGDFKYTDAFAALVDKLSQSAFAIQVIERATMDATGHLSRSDSQQYWQGQISAKKAWYATIRAAELKKSLADPFWHRYAIEDVYLRVFGREASAGDLQYWMARSDAWRETYNANLNYLYNEASGAELKATVTRAVNSRYASFQPSEYEALMAASKARRLDFEGMKKWFHERH